ACEQAGSGKVSRIAAGERLRSGPRTWRYPVHAGGLLAPYGIPRQRLCHEPPGTAVFAERKIKGHLVPYGHAEYRHPDEENSAEMVVQQKKRKDVQGSGQRA